MICHDRPIGLCCDDQAEQVIGHGYQRYQAYVIAAAVLVVLGVAGWRAYDWWETKKAAEAWLLATRGDLARTSRVVTPVRHSSAPAWSADHRGHPAGWVSDLRAAGPGARRSGRSPPAGRI